MPKQQPRPGVETVNKKQPQLRGADVAAAFVGRLGSNHKDEVVIVTDEATFWKTYLPSITVDGVVIELGPDTPPLPVILARRLSERPGSKLRRYRELLTWLRDGASDRDILAIAQQLN